MPSLANLKKNLFTAFIIIKCIVFYITFILILNHDIYQFFNNSVSFDISISLINFNHELQGSIQAGIFCV